MKTTEGTSSAYRSGVREGEKKTTKATNKNSSRGYIEATEIRESTYIEEKRKQIKTELKQKACRPGMLV